MPAEQPPTDRPQIAQSYSGALARRRMARGRCPECNALPGDHGGWGGAVCSLRDDGVAARIAQYNAEEAHRDH